MPIYSFFHLLFCPTTATNAFMDAQTADFAGCDLFDHIDDFLNFPSDDVIDNFSTNDLTDMVDPAAADFPPLPDSLNGDDDFFSVERVPAMTCGHGAAVPALSHEEPGKLGSFDELDIGADMDWVSGFFDDSGSYSLDFATIPTTINDNGSGGRSNKDDSLFQTSSPVSVLESHSLGGGGSSSPSSIATTSTSSSSSSSSGFGGSSNIICGNPFAPISSPPDTMVIPGRARTKRTRPASFPSRAHVAAPVFPSCSEPELPVPSDPESFGECKSPAMLMVKKKKKKKSLPVDATDGEEAVVPPVRKCMHCEITKTPQWRAGPMGPKTLCNACGVRYKSGRLFPEYRPAASPTFVPSIHSNSHKKVVEMRIKASQSAAASGVPLPENPATKGCDLLQFIRRRE